MSREALMLQAHPVPKISEFDDDLRSFGLKYVSLWDDTTSSWADPGPTFTLAAQRRNESVAARLIGTMEQELRSYPSSSFDQAEWRRRIFGSLRAFGEECFAFPDRHFDIIFSPEYFSVTRSFARQAHAFDENIDPQSLAQALRNVWVMNCLQMFLGGKPTLTPSVFAYSMLYPYTDNYLDQVDLSPEAKAGACGRLASRLSGWRPNPVDEHEAAVFHLVGMIEDEFPRAGFPEVYQSLLAIHAGQTASLAQQRRICSLDPSDLLRISVEKGGSSVLADGWLVAGKLKREEAEFIFGFGVMLQLLDDLQDVPEDRKAGHWTLFTRAAMAGDLDSLTSRLARFMVATLSSGECFRGAAGLELRELILRNSVMLMMRAIADSVELYPRVFLRHVERFSPMRFSFLRAQRRMVEKKFARIWPAVSKQRNLRSIFDLLG